MLATGTQAIIPKARGMFAKRISPADYEELMRRRTVPEVAALLKRHPYFKDSLATLSTIDPHRGQIEELLSMDIFEKYQSLLHYDFSDDSFSAYYLRECEMREVLRALHMLSIGLAGAYMNQIPSYLVGKTEVDLFALGQARNLEQLVEAVRGTPWHRPLRARFLADPYLRDFPAAEAALLRAYYEGVFALMEKDMRGREAAAVRDLLLQEIEVYNLELLLRIKLYFPTVYREDELRSLLMPWYWRIGKRRMDVLVQAETPESYLALLRNIPSLRYMGGATPDDLAAEGGRQTYHHARTVLHLTSAPHAALAAFISLAKLERQNVVNVIEGVRYGLAPERVRSMLYLS